MRKDRHFAASRVGRRHCCVFVDGPRADSLGVMVERVSPGARIGWGKPGVRTLRLAAAMLAVVGERCGGEWGGLMGALADELADFGPEWTLGLGTLWVWCVARGRHPLTLTFGVN